MSRPAKQHVPGEGCCNNRKPVPMWLLDGYTVYGHNFANAIRQAFIDHGANPDELWCNECATELERLRDNFVDGLPLFVGMIATVASLVPGIGTAVSSALGAGLALAQGQSITDAFVAGIKSSLPGGQLTEAGLNVGQAVVEGKSIDRVALAALPIDDATKYILDRALVVTRGLVEGAPLDDIAAGELYEQLPEYAQRSVDIAVAVKDGRSFGDILVEQSMRVLPPALAASYLTGVALGAAKKAEPAVKTARLGGKVITADQSYINAFAAQGMLINAANPLLAAYRSVKTWPPQAYTNSEWQRGFDIGAAVSQNHSEPGPGQDAIKNTLGSGSLFNGFMAARETQYRLTLSKAEENMATLGRVSVPYTTSEIAELNSLGQNGLVIASRQPQALAARNVMTSTTAKRGFDVGTGIAAGHSLDGPGQQRVRDLLGLSRQGGSQEQQQGYDVAQAIQYAFTKSGGVAGNPSVAAGQMLVGGLAGSNMTPDQKAGAVSAVAGNAAVRAGVVQGLDANKGFFTKVLEFFGLA